MTSTTKPGLVELLCSFDLTLGLARRLLKLRLESTAAGTDRSHETFQESTALPLLMLCLDSLGFIVAQQRLQASSSSASRGELQGLGLRQDHQILPVFHVYLQQLVSVSALFLAGKTYVTFAAVHPPGRRFGCRPHSCPCSCGASETAVG